MARLLPTVLLLLLAGCAAPERPTLWRAERGLVWCYRTLAEPECRTRPEPSAGRRLIAAAPRLSFEPLGAVADADATAD